MVIACANVVNIWPWFSDLSGSGICVEMVPTVAKNVPHLPTAALLLCGALSWPEPGVTFLLPPFSKPRALFEPDTLRPFGVGRSSPSSA